MVFFGGLLFLDSRSAKPPEQTHISPQKEKVSDPELFLILFFQHYF